MPAKKDPDASVSVPCFYGAELRFKREQEGLTLEQLAKDSFRGISFLSQIERGERRMPMDLARHVDERLGTDGFFQRRCEDAAKARRTGHPLYFADVPDLEKQAETLEEWAPNVIPGLLQTRMYMQRLVQSEAPQEPPTVVEDRVRARLTRAELWKRPDRPSYWGILGESVIRDTPLPAGEMAEQLEHILDLIRSTRSVLQIIPASTPWYPLMHAMAKIMTFSDAPPLVWTEGNFDGQIVDYPAAVKGYRRSYDRLRAVALAPDASLALVEQAVRTYRHAAQQEA